MNRALLVGSHITFPEGFASTRFVRLLSKGLFETGVKVHVLVAAGHAGRQVSRGCIEGVTYEYAVQRRAPWHRRMPKWSLAMWELVKTLQGVTRRLDVNREDVILYYGDSVAHLLGLRIVGLAFRIPVIAFLVEWPPGDVVQPTWVVENDISRYVPILQGGALFRLNARLFYRHVVRLSDGVIVISRFLEKKCTETATSLRKNARIIRVPVLVTRKEIPFDANAMESRIIELKKEMWKAAKELEFEAAARMRDEMAELEEQLLAFGGTTTFELKNSGKPKPSSSKRKKKKF